MKKAGVFNTIIALTFVAFTASAGEYSRVQKKHPLVLETVDDEGMKGRSIVTAGIGLNFLGFNLEARYFLNDYYSFSDHIQESKSSPMYNLAVDYGLGKRVSIGAALGYQTARITLRDIMTPDDRHYDNWKRIHLAARGDYYIIAKTNVNLYTGLKLGYNIYTVESTIPNSAYPGYEERLIKPSPVSTQAHFGFSYFVNGLVGFNAEAGIGWGGPYVVAVGATIKL